MRGQVVGAQDRPPGPELDDRDRAQVHRPHPEPLEGQVEQGQQDDLEDTVVTHHDGPGLDGRRLAVAGDLARSSVPGGRPSRAGPEACRAPAGPVPGRRAATRHRAPSSRSGCGARPRARRRSGPRPRRGAGPARPPGDLGEPGIGPADARPALGGASRRRWPRPSRSSAREGSGPGRARRRRAPAAPERRAASPGARRPSRPAAARSRSADCRPGPGSGPPRCTSTRRGGPGRGSRRGRRG